ncbi:MAG: ZIP family zinc transporter [Novosphingobium sp.]|nr:ZIP family zinc transporter [Novosphingobium sp.]
MPEFIVAGLWGLVSGSGLLVGATIADAFFGRLTHSMIAAIMGFGGGVLIAVVGTELIGGQDPAGLGPLAILALLAGAAIFSGNNWYLARRGAKHRKRCGECTEQPSEGQHQGSGTAIALGSVLDGIPEALVIGMSVAGGRGISLAIVAGFFLANVPQGLSSASGMKLAGRSRRYIYAVWIGIPVLVCMSAGAGYIVLGSAETLAPAILSFAAGAVIAMLAETMIPEAFEKAPPFIGLITVMGFLAAYLLAQH